MHNKLILLSILLLLILTKPLGANTPWKLVNETEDKIKIYARDHGDTLLEMRAVGPIDLPPARVFMSLSNLSHYRNYVPHTTELRFVKQEGRQSWVYHRLSPPFIDNRDYVAHYYDLTPPATKGKQPPYYLLLYTLDKNIGPPPQEGVVRVPANEGYWIILPRQGGQKSLVIYTGHADAGGMLPKVLINLANTKGLPGTLQGLGQCAADPRYSNPPPPLTSPLPKVPKTLWAKVREAHRLIKELQNSQSLRE